VGCAAQRDKSLVYVAGIVGVPWQDIAVDPMDLTKGYLTARQIADQNIWPRIVGDSTANPPVKPTDPHMIESIVPRTGLASPTSDATADPINGHEWNPAAATPMPNADLQYACVFPINPPKTCTEPTDCDCFVPANGNAAAAQSPLCQGANNMYSNVQARAKAYPGIRQLQVLQGLGDQAIVASICSPNTTSTVAVDYGYRPAVRALLDRLRTPLRPRCLDLSIPVRPAGNVACEVIEAFVLAPGESCNCTEPGRRPALPSSLPPEVLSAGTCFCAIEQTSGMDKTVCETSEVLPANVASGWCYVDPAQAGANAPAICPIVKDCAPTSRRTIRFTSPASEPRAGAVAFLQCDPQSPPTPGDGHDPCP
jgi:hypothetical protein